MIVAGDETSVGLIPEPASEEAENFITNNPELQFERESIGGKNAALVGDFLETEYPVLKIFTL